MARPWICEGCGHNRSWHDWVGGEERCRLCAVCGREDAVHGGWGHDFTFCVCEPDQTGFGAEGGTEGAGMGDVA